MRYHVELVVPAATPASAPTTAELKLTPGLIEHVSVYFPPGSGGYLYVQIWLNGYQLIPWERAAWLRGDDLLIPDSGKYEVTEEPYLLTVKAYSTATLYAHRVMISAELSPYPPRREPMGDTSFVGRNFD
jgi:hypothetical protein